MEQEVVERRRWLTQAEFLDLLGATNLIPGPNSTEMAIHIGWRQGRWAGLVVAGVCFILPAALIVLTLAWVYQRNGTQPAAAHMLYGIKPVIIVIVAQALARLARQALKSAMLTAIAALGTGLVLLGVNELAVLVGAGLLAAGIGRLEISPGRGAGSLQLAPLGALTTGLAGGSAASSVPFGLLPLFLFFLKVGSVLFGSGYVLLAFIRADLVQHWGWLSDSQLLDAIAIGQVTPGPVFTTATFIGYILGGIPGAIVATVGIFLPAFVFVAISGPLVPRLRRSRLAGAFLDGVNAASLSLIAVVTWHLARASLVDGPTVFLALLSGLILWCRPVNSVWLILGGGVLGSLRWLF